MNKPPVPKYPEPRIVNDPGGCSLFVLMITSSLLFGVVSLGAMVLKLGFV